jgi:MFS family permease
MAWRIQRGRGRNPATAARLGSRAGRMAKEEEMTGQLDWKWIGIGVVVMIVLNLVGGLILGLVLAPQLEGVTSPEEVTLSGGQIVLATVINFLAFAIGGFIVGLKSAGRTILEPGISAAIAVLIALLISGNFSIVNLFVGGVVPFIAGVLGGWLGERRQGTV